MSLFQAPFGWPQLIWVILATISLLESAVKHGKPRTGEYSVNQTGIGTLITIALLWWGGFFGG